MHELFEFPELRKRALGKIRFDSIRFDGKINDSTRREDKRHRLGGLGSQAHGGEQWIADGAAGLQI